MERPAPTPRTASTSTDSTTVDPSPLLENPTRNRGFRSGRLSPGPALLGATWFVLRAGSRRIMREPSMVVREAAAEQLEERQSDWASSRPVVLLDIMWNFSFVIVAIAVLVLSWDERESKPLRVWIVCYALQCVLHMVCVCIQYRRRSLSLQSTAGRRSRENPGLGAGDGAEEGGQHGNEPRQDDERINSLKQIIQQTVILMVSHENQLQLYEPLCKACLGQTIMCIFMHPDWYPVGPHKTVLIPHRRICPLANKSHFSYPFTVLQIHMPHYFIVFLFGASVFVSIAKHLESANTMFSFVWWIIGFYWVSSVGQTLIHDAPQLYWLCIVFLAFDVLFVVFCVALACVIGIAVCCCLPSLIAILYAVADQEEASDEDIHQLPKYKFLRIVEAEKLSSETSEPSGGIMIECGSETPIEHVVSAEDAECCICLSAYDDGVELRELSCNHHFHSSCIDKWLYINATCPLCKYSITKSATHRRETV